MSIVMQNQGLIERIRSETDFNISELNEEAEKIHQGILTKLNSFTPEGTTHGKVFSSRSIGYITQLIRLDSSVDEDKYILIRDNVTSLDDSKESEKTTRGMFKDSNNGLYSPKTFCEYAMLFGQGLYMFERNIAEQPTVGTKLMEPELAFAFTVADRLSELKAPLERLANRYKNFDFETIMNIHNKLKIISERSLFQPEIVKEALLGYKGLELNKL